MKLIVLLFFLISCSQKTKHSQNLSRLFADYWEDHSKLYPLDATQQGDNRYNDLLPDDMSEAFRKKEHDFRKKYLTKLLTFPREELSKEDQTSYDMLRYELELELESEKFPTWLIPYHQFWGLPQTIAQLGSGTQYQPFVTVKDYENWVSRVSGFEQWTKTAVQNFREGTKAGWVLPKPLVLKMIGQLEKLIKKDPKESLFYGPIENLPKSFSAEEKERLKKLYLEVIQNKIFPSYARLKTYLEGEYLSRARSTHGLSSLPKGRPFYDFLVRYWTTTDLRASEIHEIGLKEVARIRSEMEKVKKSVGHRGPLKTFFAHLRNDKKLMPYQSPEEILEAFHQIHKKMSPKLREYFGRVPKTPFEIRQTEAFRAATASAEYHPGSPDGKRPGIFYVPIVDATRYNITSGMESLFLHEAIPGHHYQISLQQENKSLPAFRRFAWYGAYGEGWALYTESLGKELGLYTDPYQYMGALSDEMHRALRLVVDTGIHSKGMKREEAIRYLMNNEPISLNDATAEVERYMAIPGQALSYKIGALKIRELRGKYQKELGKKFSLKAFHDEFLKDGCMPLAVIEKKLGAWAKERGR
jgi:uncharacterized protein (DUF885 family)